MNTIRGAALATALLCAGAASAQAPNAGATSAPPSAAPAAPHEPTAAMKAAHLEHIAVLLDLTEGQRAPVQAALEEEHAQMHAAMEQAHASGTPPDPQQMKALHQKLAQQTLQKLANVLSATQLKKLQALQDMHPVPGPHMMHAPPPGAPSQN